MRLVITKRLHSTARMLDDHDLPGAKEMLGREDRSKGIFSAPAGIADDVCVTGLDAKGGGGIDTDVHAGYQDE